MCRWFCRQVTLIGSWRLLIGSCWSGPAPARGVEPLQQVLAAVQQLDLPEDRLQAARAGRGDRAARRGTAAGSEHGSCSRREALREAAGALAQRLSPFDRVRALAWSAHALKGDFEAAWELAVRNPSFVIARG